MFASPPLPPPAQCRSKGVKEELARKKSYDRLKKERGGLLSQNQRYRKKYEEVGVKRRCEKCDAVLRYAKS